MKPTLLMCAPVAVTLMLAESACTPSNCNGLPTPFDVRATPSSDRIHLTWQGDSTDIGAYRIERAPRAAGPFQIYVWTGGAAGPGIHSFSFTDAQVQPCVEVCYRLASQHANGSVGCTTSPICAAPGGGTSNEVRNVRVAAWSRTEFRITWDADPTGIQAFNIERANSEQGPFQSHTQVAASGGPGIQTFSFSDQQIQIGQFGVKYCYRINAQRTNGATGCFTAPACSELAIQ